VTIVDHHPTSEEVLKKLNNFGIKIIYSNLDCASVLLYNLFKDKLSRESARLAAYAAISDQFDSGPLATRLISEFDKLFIQYEALILTYALDHQEKDNFKSLIFEELDKFTFPHKIKGVQETALAHLDYLVKLIRILPVRAKKLNRVAYIEGEKESSKGTIASLLIDSLGTDVGLCYKHRSDNTVNISIRAKKNFLFHLGKITKKLAERYHGFGGGHKQASGAKITQKNLMNFIHDLEKEVKSQRSD
jgi:oligoribonuclease NrnB/cAMP/cGMP phosphodiesterase (DHH superfamily)